MLCDRIWHDARLATFADGPGIGRVPDHPQRPQARRPDRGQGVLEAVAGRAADFHTAAYITMSFLEQQLPTTL